MASIKILHVVAARPNFVKIAPILEACAAHGGFDSQLIHTGQHFDECMSERFFRDLGLPRPNENLGAGGGTHAENTAATMTAFERVCLRERPDGILVVGDVDATLACALTAAKLGIRIAHVEAGLRCFDRSMPEEINRKLTDALADALFCTEASAVDNLRREGVEESKIHWVGNVMIDTLMRRRQAARSSKIMERLGIREKQYAVVTLHRPSNVDDPSALAKMLDALQTLQAETPLVFPAHPRTRRALREGGFEPRLSAMPGLIPIEPLGYLDFVRLLESALAILTDSGGIQEEALALRVPCVTLRPSTERPATVESGGNRVAGGDPARIVEAFHQALRDSEEYRLPPLWDGHAAERIARILAREWSKDIEGDKIGKDG